MTKLFDPEHGEMFYTVATYRRIKPKVMRSPGAWLKVYEDYQSADNLVFFVSMKKEP